ncbi:MAG: cytochrome c [Verrucomicrobia bacterium]|jgi:mono/diheme cytochrome c family protein|nr:cytochrome c [Verrucomicrobiota bacterium]|tara:strand:- start:20334 stop:21038 length:705 start_codon:yes stop_codon:yes gene_type:complete
MRYFFLAYAMIAVLFVGIMGFRGQKFHKPPVQVFPDMDNQDKLLAQAPSIFFADRMGGRLPVDETQPLGFNEEGASEIGGIPEYEFGGQIGYYYTGHVGDYYGTGMPEELSLTTENAGELIRRGQERFGIYCAVCHGQAGDGLGVTSRYGIPGIANFHLDPYQSELYPDGRMFEVITNGKGQMGAYGANIPIRDRWAIIAYVRTLQAAKIAADSAPKEETPATDDSAEAQEAEQ